MHNFVSVCSWNPETKIFKLVRKGKWSPLTKLPWISRTNTCNVNFVGTFVVSRDPQQVIVSCGSGFHNCQ